MLKKTPRDPQQRRIKNSRRHHFHIQTLATVVTDPRKSPELQDVYEPKEDLSQWTK